MSSESDTIMENQARSYQLRLVDYLTKRNGIVYLPTGAGKTFVAILTMRRFSQNMDKPIENNGKRAIYMCNTVELARQQMTYIKKQTNFKVGFYVGERGTDNWTRGKWEDEIRDNQVLVATAQVILDLFTQNYMKLSSVSIMVIDECHHGTGHHPFHEIMRLFHLTPPGIPLPRVVGLTGVLIKGNEINNMQKKLSDLETTFRGNIITISDTKEMENVMLYSTKPREFIVGYPTQAVDFMVVLKIKSLINDFLKTIQSIDIGKQPVRMSKGLQECRAPSKKAYISLTLKDFLYQLNDFGIYGGSFAIVSVLIEFEVKKRQAETVALRSLYRAAITLCDHVRHLLVEEISEDGKMVHDEETILNYSTQKVQIFFNYLKQAFAGKEAKDISCLVFVERRYSAKCMYGMLMHFIETTPELRNVLVPQFMIGRNALAAGFDAILERNRQKMAIQEFRNGECNLVVCSNVMEEGIDIQSCNYVFILDPLKTFNMYVQSKGRARSKDAAYGIFCPNSDKESTIQKIQKYREAHLEIANYLKDRVLERAEPQMDELIEHFSDKIKPFTNESGAVLLPSNALTLLHRYCQQLPVDAFGIILPWFNLVEQNKIVSVTLPLNSPLREVIYSDPMTTNKWAKISAAFKTCIKLYQMGELNQRFLPISIKEHVASLSDVHFEHWKKYNDNVSAKLNVKSRTYPRRCPTQLYDALPRVDEPCYAYEISIEPQFERNDYSAHIFDNLQVTSGSYALLLRKQLPRLASMPLFSNQGRVNVHVAETPKQVTVHSAEQMKQLQGFHVMLFRDLLRIWHPFFVFDNRSKENSYLIVPMLNGHIDMELVAQFQRLPVPRALSLAERYNQAPPRPEDFEGKVVTQWYADFSRKRMLVTKVHTDLSPLSMMEDNYKDKSYYNFTMEKYKCDIKDVVHKSQFLIEVTGLTDRLNFFINQRVKSTQKTRSKVMLIPELCCNFNFPGHLWVKLIFLPSILHRLKYLLHAEELRVSINKYLGLDNLPQNGSQYRPKPVTLDLSLRRNVDEVGNAIHMDEEPKTKLEPMTTKAFEKSLKKLDITDMNLHCPKYMEPIDMERNIMSTYPIELNYFCNFTYGSILNLKEMEQSDMELWTKRQFEMCEHNIYEDKVRKTPNTNNTKTLPALISGCGPMIPVDELSVLRCSQSNENIIAAEQCEFLAALTTASSADVFDMERFELLGDSFLKLGATLYLSNKYPDWNEGILTHVKSMLVSNRNLLYCLSDMDIPQRISSELFSPKYTWIPPCISLPYNLLALWTDKPELAKLIGPHNLEKLELSEEEVLETGTLNEKNYLRFVESCQANRIGQHADSDFSNDLNYFIGCNTLMSKVVSDTLEALLGVVVKNYGLQHGFRMLGYFGICKPDAGQPLTQLLDLQLGSKRMCTNISSSDVDDFLLNHVHLEKNLGYKFRNRAYLLQALTHPSFPTNRITGCYQELEFIGDAILDFLISAYIFEHKTRMNPGELTDLRSALVNNTTLACICVRHCFHYFILAESALLSESIRKFAEYQESEGHRVTNHVRILLEEKDVQYKMPLDSDDEAEAEIAQAETANADQCKPKTGSFNMSQNVDVPKALGDVVEALIAAVYLDCRNLQTTWSVIYKLFKPELIEFSRNVPLNPIRMLYEHKLANPQFGKPVIDDGLVMMSCQFTCVDKTIQVYGFGGNSSQAKLAAAKHALLKLAKCET